MQKVPGTKKDEKRGLTNYFRISPQELQAWLDRLSTERVLITPCSVDGTLLYRRVSSSRAIAWQPGRPALPVKEVFIPPTERLFTIHKNGREINLTETFSAEPVVVFGVRPCDAHGVRLLDAAFLGTAPADPYYARRRENTTLIGLACMEMTSSCFCTSMGGSPDDSTDMDIMLYRTDESYLVEFVTEKGKCLIPSDEWNTVNGDPQSSISNPQSAIPNPSAIPWQDVFKSTFWQSYSERCLSCRACSYVCPTCRCTIARDETIGQGEYERIRCWDACSGENYRRLAGGHQPRSGKDERLRNRIMCKFFYFPQLYGLGELPACTGCGRCIDVCPVNVDITEALIELGGRV